MNVQTRTWITGWILILSAAWCFIYAKLNFESENYYSALIDFIVGIIAAWPGISKVRKTIY